MDIGHFGAGLALKKADTANEINLGVLTLAVLLLDLLYYIFLIAGIEDILTNHATFVSTLPYSHGVIASIAWSAVAFTTVWLLGHKRWKKPLRSASTVAIAVFSHLVLDIIYFALGIPGGILTAIQWAIVVLGLWLYISTVNREAQVSVLGLIVLTSIPVVVLSLPSILLLITGPISTTELPDPTIIGVVGMVQILVCVAVAYWIDHIVKSRKNNKSATAA
jgi:hypothetical protein